MAGIGVRLNKLFSRNSLTSRLYGAAYSVIMTVAPMFVIIGCILAMYYTLGYNKTAFYNRELFAVTVLYIFIFSLLSCSPFNSVLSKYMTDKIFEEKYDDILPCYYTGLIINILFTCLMGIPFYAAVYFIGHIDILYVFWSYFGYTALAIVFYSQIYLSITKDYKMLSLFYTIGMVITFILAWILHRCFSVEVCYSMLVALDIGYVVIAALEYAWTRNYFPNNSQNYKGPLLYFKLHWKLVPANFFYIFGLYIHNFVFWFSRYSSVVANVYFNNKLYDMASCLAMFTNISASVIFIAQVEMHFHQRYKDYSDSVIGGKWKDIEKAKSRMFRQLMKEVTDLIQIQFTISVILFFILLIILPYFGFGGLTLSIYPSLAAGYFIIFIMYSMIIFLYYFDDYNGAIFTSFFFWLGTLLGSIWATHLPVDWFGVGLYIGAFIGYTIAFIRIRWVEKNLDEHIFCRGHLLKPVFANKPSSTIYTKPKEEIINSDVEDEVIETMKENEQIPATTQEPELTNEEKKARDLNDFFNRGDVSPFRGVTKKEVVVPIVSASTTKASNHEALIEENQYDFFNREDVSPITGIKKKEEITPITKEESATKKDYQDLLATNQYDFFNRGDVSPISGVKKKEKSITVTSEETVSTTDHQDLIATNQYDFFNREDVSPITGVKKRVEPVVSKNIVPVKESSEDLKEENQYDFFDRGDVSPITGIKKHEQAVPEKKAIKKEAVPSSGKQDYVSPFYGVVYKEEAKKEPTKNNLRTTVNEEDDLLTFAIPVYLENDIPNALHTTIKSIRLDDLMRDIQWLDEEDESE